MSEKKSSFEDEIRERGQLVYPNVGDSMLPYIRQGRDVLVITQKPDGRLKKYDVPLYKRDSGQYVLHRVLKVRDNDYVICGDNRWKREYGITDKHVIGVLSAIARNGRELPVTDRKYRLFVHVWCDFFFVRATFLWLKSLPKRVKRKLKR